MFSSVSNFDLVISKDIRILRLMFSPVSNFIWSFPDDIKYWGWCFLQCQIVIWSFPEILQYCGWCFLQCQDFIWSFPEILIIVVDVFSSVKFYLVISKDIKYCGWCFISDTVAVERTVTYEYNKYRLAVFWLRLWILETLIILNAYFAETYLLWIMKLLADTTIILWSFSSTSPVR